MHVINCWNCGCSVPIGNDVPQGDSEASRGKVSDTYAWMDLYYDETQVFLREVRPLLREVRRFEKLLLNATPEKDRKCQTCLGHGHVDNNTGHHVCVNCRGTGKV